MTAAAKPRVDKFAVGFAISGIVAIVECWIFWAVYLWAMVHLDWTIEWQSSYGMAAFVTVFLTVCIGAVLSIEWWNE